MSDTLPAGICALRHEFSIPLAPGKALPRWVNSYVLLRRQWTAIDAGVSGSAGAILEATSGTLGTLLLTHGHPDHLGGAASLVQQTGCSVAASLAERDWIETPEKQLSARPVPGFWNLVEGGVSIDATLTDGDACPGDSALQVVATPGHSPGHQAFWDADARVLFAGDAIPVPGEMPIYDNGPATRASLERLLKLDVAVLLSAWDSPKHGAAAHEAIHLGVAMVDTVARCVEETGTETNDLPTLTRHVAQTLGLPAELAGPMLARTVRAHLT